MIVIRRGAPPQALIKDVQGLLPEQRTYENLSSETKRALKETLLDRQGYLCAYCMCRVKVVDHAKLEHVYPQSRSIAEGHPEQTIEYGNMLVTCMGGDGDACFPYENTTCDTHKGDQLISIDPTSQDCIEAIRYRRNGEIYSENRAFNHDLCETLNLNCMASFLPQGRAAVYRSLIGEISKKDPKTPEAKRAFVRKKLRSLEEAKTKEPFAGVMEYFLRRWAR